MIALVDSATSLMQHYSLRRLEVDWEQLRTNARAAVQEPHEVAPWSAYLAIRAALRTLGDHHSLLLGPQAASHLSEGASSANVAPSIRLVAPGIGYVQIPAYAGLDRQAMEDYAERLQEQIGHLTDKGACAWVVDLRGNIGGNHVAHAGGTGSATR